MFTIGQQVEVSIDNVRMVVGELSGVETRGGRDYYTIESKYGYGRKTYDFPAGVTDHQPPHNYRQAIEAYTEAPPAIFRCIECGNVVASPTATCQACGGF